jgi:DNA-binding XRE family transcriptional regulator
LYGKLTNIQAESNVCVVDIGSEHLHFVGNLPKQELMPNHFNEELGERIRSAREGKMTQGILGSRVGLSRTAITNIECGRQRLLVEQLVDIADALGVSPALLLPTETKSSAVGDQAVAEMPTVQKWLSSVGAKARGRS